MFLTVMADCALKGNAAIHVFAGHFLFSRSAKNDSTRWSCFNFH